MRVEEGDVILLLLFHKCQKMSELVPRDQFASSGKKLQPDGKFFVTDRLTIDYSRPSPQDIERGFDKDARIGRPRVLG